MRGLHRTKQIEYGLVRYINRLCLIGKIVPWETWDGYYKNVELYSKYSQSKNNLVPTYLENRQDFPEFNVYKFQIVKYENKRMKSYVTPYG